MVRNRPGALDQLANPALVTDGAILKSDLTLAQIEHALEVFSPVYDYVNAKFKNDKPEKWRR